MLVLMKIKNLTIGSLFVICVGCGGDATHFWELGSADAELQKCYEKLPVKLCNQVAGKSNVSVKASVTEKTPCEDVKMAISLACSSQVNSRKIETMAQFLRSALECEEHYKSKQDKVCPKVDAPQN